MKKKLLLLIVSVASGSLLAMQSGYNDTLGKKNTRVPLLSSHTLNDAHIDAQAERRVDELQERLNSASIMDITLLQGLKARALGYAREFSSSLTACETLRSFASSVQNLIECLDDNEPKNGEDLSFARYRDRSRAPSPALSGDREPALFFADTAALPEDMPAVSHEARVPTHSKQRPICSLSWRKAQEYEAAQERLYVTLFALKDDEGGLPNKKYELECLIAEAVNYADDAQLYSSFREYFENIAEQAEDLLKKVQ
ncbi:hypothetical protein CVU75_02055 [Candidatus Dependentiae bacterium HGW-Dependentiae-1]|nr:MAG: hypothetical protein CVU75_02055 [Candidatus Dependentiae bacterium HGW-Dependentiae-1]